MKTFGYRKVFVLTLVITLTLIITGALSGLNHHPTNQGKMRLLHPPFLISAQAASTSVIADRLDDEAGISAYFETTDPINLDNAEDAYRVVEAKTSDYIIGSVPVPGYPEFYDPHVFVHKDGWILAYYLKEVSVAKIIDILSATVSTTNLHTVVSEMASAAGVPFTSVNYYDFRYPNATHILMVGENDSSGTSFTITLPSSYGYYERGWARDYYGSNSIKLNGVGLPRSYYYGSPYFLSFGVITASQLLPDTEHTVEITTSGSYGVLIIVYRE
jgi:hypothetical protein